MSNEGIDDRKEVHVTRSKQKQIKTIIRNYFSTLDCQVKNLITLIVAEDGGKDTFIYCL